MAQVRIFDNVPNNPDSVVQSNWMLDTDTGNWILNNSPEAKFYDRTWVVSQGYPIMGEGLLLNVNKSGCGCDHNNSNNMAVTNSMPAQNGCFGQAVFFGNGGGGANQWSIILDNGTASTYEGVIFDGSGLLQYAFNIAAVPASPFLVDGSFGATTLARLQSISQASQTRVSHLWVENTKSSGGAASTGFFQGGFLKQSFATLNGDAPIDQKVNLLTLLQPQDQIQNIRVSDDFLFEANFRSALHFKLPAGEKISISLSIDKNCA